MISKLKKINREIFVTSFKDYGVELCWLLWVFAELAKCFWTSFLFIFSILIPVVSSGYDIKKKLKTKKIPSMWELSLVPQAQILFLKDFKTAYITS